VSDISPWTSPRTFPPNPNHKPNPNSNPNPNTNPTDPTLTLTLTIPTPLLTLTLTEQGRGMSDGIIVHGEQSVSHVNNAETDYHRGTYYNKDSTALCRIHTPVLLPLFCVVTSFLLIYCTMSVFLIVGPKCTLAASRAVLPPWWVTLSTLRGVY